MMMETATASGPNRLPPEILCEIFVRCVDAGVPSTTCSSPLGLSHVCSFWRSTAIISAQLWYKLALTLPLDPSTGISESTLPSLVESWFSRAGTKPLIFSLTEKDDLVDIDTLDCLMAVLSLPRFSLRILRLSLDGPSLDRWIPLTMLNPDSFPILESLTMIERRGYDDGLYISDVSAFRSAPFLHSLNLRIPSFESVDIDSFPWLQLKHLMLHLQHPAKEWNIIRHLLVNLEWCDIEMELLESDTETLTPDTISATTYPQLRYLRFDLCDLLEDDTSSPWLNMEFPALETLVHESSQLYHCMPTPRTSLYITTIHDGYVAELEALLSRCSYTLERFEIHCLRAPGPDAAVYNILKVLRDAMSSMRSLRKLVIGIDLREHENISALGSWVDDIVDEYQGSSQAENIVAAGAQRHISLLVCATTDEQVKDFFSILKIQTPLCGHGSGANHSSTPNFVYNQTKVDVLKWRLDV